MDLIGTYKLVHSATAPYTLFSVTHETLSKVDQILGPKASLNKYKKIWITPCIQLDHNGINRKYTLNIQTCGDWIRHGWITNGSLRK
jgi:hypothetical protein